MVSEARGRLFRRKDGKYLIYLPKDLAEDSMFPWQGVDSALVKVSFKPSGPKKLLIEKWRPIGVIDLERGLLSQMLTELGLTDREASDLTRNLRQEIEKQLFAKWKLHVNPETSRMFLKSAFVLTQGIVSTLAKAEKNKEVIYFT